MARRRKKKTAATGNLYGRSAPRDALSLLKQGIQALRRGEFQLAASVAAQVQRMADDPSFSEAATGLAAEAYFRIAVNNEEPDQSLRLLDNALRCTPDDPRLRFHRGVALWRLGSVPEAVQEFDAVASREPDRPGLAYLRHLGKAVISQSAAGGELRPEEANTLALVQGLMQKKPAGDFRSLLEKPMLGNKAVVWRGLIQLCDDAVESAHETLQSVSARRGSKTIQRMLRYYEGVAAMRVGKVEDARNAWTRARTDGLATPWLHENLVGLLREQATQLAEEGRWRDLVTMMERFAVTVEDRILEETIGLAYYRLGYQEAQAGKWQAAIRHWRKANTYISSRHLAQNLALAEEAQENWMEAAQAWREMVRRRPRKSDHPDYLSDAQVAAIWSHAAECYARVGEFEEAITCHKNAVKYAPENTGLRMQLVDALVAGEHPEAAMNELERILELDPQHIDALMQMGRLQDDFWYGSSLPIWRRALALDPDNAEIKEALVEKYLKQVGALRGERGYWFGMFMSPPEKIKVLQQGLQDLPDHPRLLAELGKVYVSVDDKQKAWEHLQRAWDAAPQDTSIVSIAMHELLHIDGEDIVEERLAQAREIPRLLPVFWTDQGDMVLACELDQEWAVRFFDEALALTEAPWVELSKASVLVHIYEMLHQKKERALCERYAQRIRAEVPDSGAVEYIEAHRLYHEKKDHQGALRVMRKAKRVATKAGDQSMLSHIGLIEDILTGRASGIVEMMRELEQAGLLPDDLEDIEDLEDISHR